MLTKRLAAGLSSAGLVGTRTKVGATAANADGGDSDTPPELAQQNSRQPGPEYSVADEDADVYAVRQIRTDQGFSASEIDDIFEANPIRGTQNFQEAYGLNLTGELDAPTWQQLSDLYFPSDSGAAVGPGDRGRVVYAIQRLPRDHGYDVHRTGHFKDAVEAVREFQRNTRTDDGETCLDDDGLTGEHTWRALVTGGI